MIIDDLATCLPDISKEYFIRAHFLVRHFIGVCFDGLAYIYRHIEVFHRQPAFNFAISRRYFLSYKVKRERRLHDD